MSHFVWGDWRTCFRCRLPTVSDDVAQNYTFLLDVPPWQQELLRRGAPEATGTHLELETFRCSHCGHPHFRWSRWEYVGWHEDWPDEGNSIDHSRDPLDLGHPCPEMHDGIPKAVQSSFTEACRVWNASANAVALLCRRTLQACLRALPGTDPSMSLNGEIREAVKAHALGVEVKEAMFQIASLGAVAAHPRTDLSAEDELVEIDQDEALRLLALTWNLVLRLFPPDDGSAQLIEALRPSVSTKHMPPRKRAKSGKT